MNKEVNEFIFGNDDNTRLFLQEIWTTIQASPNRAFLIRGLWLPEDAEALEEVMRDHNLTCLAMTKPLLGLYKVILYHVQQIVSNFPFPRKVALQAFSQDGQQSKRKKGVAFERTKKIVLYHVDDAPSCISRTKPKSSWVSPRAGIG